MSSGGQQTTQTSGLSPEIAPYLSGFLGAASQAAQLPYQQYPGQRVADLSPMQTGALGGINSAMYGNSAMNSGAGYLDSTIRNAGNMNPYTDQVENTSIADATRAYNQATSGISDQFNAPGVWGSAQQRIAQDQTNTDLARGLAQGIGGIRYGAYNDSQNRAMQAVPQASNLYQSLLGGLSTGLQAGNVDRTQNQSLLDSLYNEWQNSYQYPWTQLNNFGGAVGSMMGAAPRTQTTTGPGTDPFAAGLGTLALSQYLGKSGK